MNEVLTWPELCARRSESLFYFGVINLVLALIFIGFSAFSDVKITGANAWFKPVKFALSIGIFSITMAGFTAYLNEYPKTVWLFNWTVIVLFGFEIVYIALQAFRGELSHFNISSPLYSFLYSLMGLAAAAVTVFTAHLGLLFWKNDFPQLPDYYLWSIRLGIFIFVIFSLEGGIMGSRLTHTVGASDGGPGLSFLGWSTRFGDLRVAHFIGMHALQVLPLLSVFLLRNVKLTFMFSGLYLLLAVWVLVQALGGKPLIKF